MTDEGWKLVPIEPTEEMLGFGIDGWNGFAGPRNKMCNAYRRMLAASPAPPVEGTADIIPAAREWPKPGDKMRFLDEGGYPRDLVEAREHFAKGQIATVRDFHLGDWHSTIAFEGIPGYFNSVLFEYADDAALTAIGARDE